MWTTGTMNGYKIAMKHFDEASIYGINEGKISKLMIKKDGHILYNFERGLNVDAMDEGAREVYAYLMDKFN